MKTQTRGTCSCCGDEMAVLKSGLMSRHGYTIEHGWGQVGTCFGRAHPPMELVREPAENYANQIRRQVQDLREDAMDWMDGTTTPEKCPDIASAWKPTMIPWADANVYQQTACLEKLIGEALWRAEGGERVANQLIALLNKVHGQPLTIIDLEV